MNNKTQTMLDMIVNNQKKLRKKMTFEVAPNDTAIMGALIQAARGVETDKEKYLQCKKILKKNTDIFSAFRGMARTMIISKMTVVDNPEEYLNGCLVVYKKLRSIHMLVASPFMIMAAMTIYECGGIERADELIEKLESLYKSLKKKHPLLITDNDRGYLSMLVASGMDIEMISESIENSYKVCKNISIDKNKTNSLAQILALSSKDPNVNSKEVVTLLKLLKSNGHPVSKRYGLGAVGALVLLDDSVEKKVELVSEISDYLNKFSAFKWYHMNKKIRTVYACLIAVMVNSENISENVVGNISNTMTMTIVEEMIMSMVILMTVSSEYISTSD